MPFTDEYIAKEIMDMRTQMIAKEVARSVPSQSRYLTQSSRRVVWLPRQGCRVLAALGCRLVAMGRRLEQYGQSQLSLQQG
jgi:hypothetical protein